MYQKWPCTGPFLGHLVGKEGLEPSIRKELVPKTSAYTNSATCPIFNMTECAREESNLRPSR